MNKFEVIYSLSDFKFNYLINSERLFNKTFVFFLILDSKIFSN